MGDDGVSPPFPPNETASEAASLSADSDPLIHLRATETRRFERPPTVEQWVPTERLEAVAVDLAERALRPDADQADQWLVHGDRRYACLADTDLYDAWLIHWAPSARLEFHDHGGSRGVVVVTEGRLVEHYFDGQQPALRRRAIDVGDVVTIPLSRIHAVVNPGQKAALSLHLYSPPLRSMTFFDRRAHDRSPSETSAPSRTELVT